MLIVAAFAPQTGAEPVAYWSFNEDFTATIGGPEYDGVPANGPVIDPSVSRFDGGSARFIRNEEHFIHIPKSPISQGSHTYAAWYNLDLESMDGSDRYFVLEASDGNTWPASYGLRRSDGEPVGQVFTHDDGITGGTPNTSFPAGEPGEWRHIAVTYNAETLRLKAYLDGEAIAVRALRSDATTISPSDYLNIGGHRGGTGRNWEGWIDEVAVWDRVLSHREIELLQMTSPDLIGGFRHAGYEAWIDGFEIPHDLLLPEADPGGNGVTNLESYAFGLDPTETRREGLPEVSGPQSDANGDFVTVTISRNPEAENVNLAVEVSSDLIEWEPGEATVLLDRADLQVLRVEIPDR